MIVSEGADGMLRCEWGNSASEYPSYHDREWGFPVADDRRLFEKLSLEGFQSGLSWLTILRRRPGFREAFADFDIPAVAGMGPDDVERLVQDPGIIRHRGKIEATINNARRALEVIEEAGSLASLVWSFEPESPGGIEAATTPESTAMSKELKKRGFTYVGPTTCYAFMQAMGIVNDHLPDCHVHAAAERARKSFPRPQAA